MSTGRTLEWVLAPLSVERFLHEVWAARHEMIERHAPAYFEHLFGEAHVEDFLEYVRPDVDAIRLVRANDDLNGYRLAGGAVDTVRVRNAFAEGYTIVLNGLERHVAGVAEVARSIEADLNFETQVNAYITPPRSQGFRPHYDDHDVLILQTHGSKRWSIYDHHPSVPEHELSLRNPFVEDLATPPSLLDLRAGDVLYIPRGMVHAAEAGAEPSIHLTFGIHPPTVLTLATRALEALSLRDDRLLTRLPPRYLDDAEIRQTLDGLVGAVADDVSRPDVVAEGLASIEDGLVRRGRCRPTGQLVANSLATHEIDGRTRVEKSRPLLARVLALDGGVALQFAQTLVRAGADHRAAMLFVARSSEAFRAEDVPGLSEAQQVELVRKLVLDGFLVRLTDD